MGNVQAVYAKNLVEASDILWEVNGWEFGSRGLFMVVKGNRDHHIVHLTQLSSSSPTPAKDKNPR